MASCTLALEIKKPSNMKSFVNFSARARPAGNITASSKVSDTMLKCGDGAAFFSLTFPQDLYQKMRYDHERMKSEPLNAYPAFDFFITANHLVDWVWPSAGRKQQRVDRSADAITRICEHLADAAKHVVLTTAHRGVVRTSYVGEGDAAGLFVELEPEEAKELGASPPRLLAIDLAKMVLDYWERRGLGAA